MATEEIAKKLSIVPVEIEPGDGAGKSTLPLDEDPFTPEEALQPPADFDQLAHLTAVSRVRRSCIAAIVQNSVGLGYTLEPVEGHEDEVDEDEIRDAIEAIESRARRDVRLGRPNFKRLMAAVKWDEQEVGQGFLEVSRDRRTGEIDGFYHCPGKRTRRLRDRSGWVVGKKGDPVSAQVRYYNFGEKVEYDREGKPTNKLKGKGPLGSGARWGTNELIPFILYTSESADYGLPPDAALVYDYLGDERAAESNADFFDGSGVPPTVMFVRGVQGNENEQGEIQVEVDPRTVTAIIDTLRPGSSMVRRVAVVPLPPDVEVDVEQLSIRSDRDIGFVDYRKDNRRAILGAWRLSPIFVADIEDTNYSTAAVERAVTKEQVFDPEQERTSDILTWSLLRELGLGHLRFAFSGLEIKSDEARAQSADAMADRGVIRKGEYRDAHGFGPLPEAKEGEDPDPAGETMPFGWNNELMEPPGEAGGMTLPSEPVDPNDVVVDEPDIEAEEDPTIEEVAKLEPNEALFAESLDDALERVAVQLGPDFALQPVVVEKADGAIVVKPYRASSNGHGPE